MRRLSELECDTIWAVCNKELVTVVVAGGWILWHRPAWPAKRVLGILMAVGLAVQTIANPGMQWAFGVVGLAVTVPTVFGAMLTASAVLEFSVLGERLSRRSIFAIGLLLGSLALLGVAARAAGKSISLANPAVVAMGVGAACVAGGIYAVLTIAIRHTVTRETPKSAVLLITTSMAVVTLGPWCVYRFGVQELLNTPTEQVWWMLAAGILNLIAFIAITKGLELTTAVHANVLNASQVGMAAIAGMTMFNEPLTGWLVVGVALTLVGIVL
ncbi:MAG TPA: DMT family transporter, partial [Thermoguttaceae bacterium]|nr:DMT family transporter [Thermoguttaceae bacterium]